MATMRQFPGKSWWELNNFPQFNEYICAIFKERKFGNVESKHWTFAILDFFHNNNTFCENIVCVLRPSCVRKWNPATFSYLIHQIIGFYSSTEPIFSFTFIVFALIFCGTDCFFIYCTLCCWKSLESRKTHVSGDLLDFFSKCLTFIRICWMFSTNLLHIENTISTEIWHVMKHLLFMLYYVSKNLIYYIRIFIKMLVHSFNFFIWNL